MNKGKYLLFAAALLIAGGCRGGEPPQDAGGQDREGDSSETADGAALQIKTSKKVCPADVAKLEADMKGKEQQLREVYQKLQIQSVLLGFVDEVAAAAGEREFADVAGIGARYSETLKKADPAWSEDVTKLIDNVIRVRVEAYASCMAVAKKSTSWCDLVEKSWKGDGRMCLTVYEVFALAYGEAVKEGKGCDEAMKKAAASNKQESASFCKAVKDMKPDACPWGEKTPPGAYCRAAASRGKLGYCKKVEGQWDESKEACCNLFAWRFSGLFSGKSQPMGVPEAKVIEGESAGCMNALKWGLFENLAPVFGVEFQFEPAMKDEIFGEFLCPMEIYWSAMEM